MNAILLSLLLTASLFANVPSCATYEQAFLSFGETFTDTNSCQSQAASIDAFKQLLLNHCTVDTDSITIVYYLHQHPCTSEVQQ